MLVSLIIILKITYSDNKNYSQFQTGWGSAKLPDGVRGSTRATHAHDNGPEGYPPGRYGVLY
jgi:hypothetical protein